MQTGEGAGDSVRPLTARDRIAAAKEALSVAGTQRAPVPRPHTAGGNVSATATSSQREIASRMKCVARCSERDFRTPSPLVTPPRCSRMTEKKRQQILENRRRVREMMEKQKGRGASRR